MLLLLTTTITIYRPFSRFNGSAALRYDFGRKQFPKKMATAEKTDFYPFLMPVRAAKIRFYS